MVEYKEKDRVTIFDDGSLDGVVNSLEEMKKQKRDLEMSIAILEAWIEGEDVIKALQDLE